ncbi:protein of unknown function [Methylococcus capsulatus]|uniref:Uncharacterized protein n=1 Tax=Methylococcus capsulatus TaxID=414 RepID=A0AA35UFL9_METCP|nr:protein of unknown function [Methylococcus capsulatus]
MLEGWRGRFVILVPQQTWAESWKAAIWSEDIAIGVSISVHSTPSAHLGRAMFSPGVVEPLKRT